MGQHGALDILLPKSSKHPLSTGHTRYEPSFTIMNAVLSAVKVSVPSTVLTIGMKNVRQHMAE
jgi:hypothetical protein